jgi:hypothetical protein
MMAVRIASTAPTPNVIPLAEWAQAPLDSDIIRQYKPIPESMVNPAAAFR